MDSSITVVIPTSPIKSHPDTAIIDECIRSVKRHLPDSEIILQFDGVHPEQTKFAEQYHEYKSRMLWKCLHEYDNVIPFIFEEHEHQSGMMQKTISEVNTPLILYVESDTMLTEDTINWKKCVQFIESGKAHTIRYHFENVIPDEHKDLMIGDAENGFLRTVQWSQRPHLTTKIYMQEVCDYFPEKAQSFIEDEWYGAVLRDYYEHGIHGWNKHSLWIYHPKGGIKRSYTKDGRQGEPKVGEGIQT